MEKREKLVLSDKDRLTISQKAMPIDLFIDIFSRAPAKSIASCRCVSKQWSSILRRQDFTDAFLKMSSARPCLLFTFKLNGKWLFFSAPQPLNPDPNSSPLVPDRHMSFPTEDSCFGISRPICGWLCSHGKNPMVCNPSTGEYITLPKDTSMSSKQNVEPYYGYDPIDKLFKVLRVSTDYQVLTLGTGELSWRMIECSTPHSFCISGGICIDGVLYYSAACDDESQNHFMLVCFDVRSEKFKFIPVGDSIRESVLINCNGKLGAVRPDDSDWLFCRETTSLELRILEDAENHKWSTHIYALPPLWENIVGDEVLYIAGMTNTGEFVLSPYGLRDPFYIFYYNVVENTIVPVEIRLGGIVALEGQKIFTFVDYVEDVKLLELPRTS